MANVMVYETTRSLSSVGAVYDRPLFVAIKRKTGGHRPPLQLGSAQSIPAASPVLPVALLVRSFRVLLRKVHPDCVSVVSVAGNSLDFFHGNRLSFPFSVGVPFFLLTLPVVVTHPVGQRVPAICPK